MKSRFGKNQPVAEDNDDQMVGSLLSRRRALALLGVAGGAVMGGGLLKGSLAQGNALPSCVVRPALTEGPYFVDERLNRSDIRADTKSGVVKEGVPLELTFLVSRVGSGGCTPLQGVMVDIWHCDALGVYSDVSDPSFNTKGQNFLRGYQVTNAAGRAVFKTIYPGWYQGRTVHIHFKLRIAGREFTSQLFFDDAVSDKVFTLQPYASKPGTRSPRNNAGDSIFRNGGSQLLLKLTGDPSKGFAATFDVGMNLA